MSQDFGSRESIERLYALDMAALHGRPVCQGHADYCAAHGHGKNVVDGVERGWCPRCGEVTVPARVSEPRFGTDAWLFTTVAVPVTGGKTERTERVRTDELTAGDVIEYDSGHREIVSRTGERKTIAGHEGLWVEVTVTEDGETSGSFWSLSSKWDRLTDAAKRELGYPVADVDVPSEREPRESDQPGQPGEREWLVRVYPDGGVTVTWPTRSGERDGAILTRTSGRAHYLIEDLQRIEDGAR
jgi:hypothetical protein